MRNINPYLVDADDVVLDNRKTPLCAVPPIVFGSMPNDGGHLLLSDEERMELLARAPGAEAVLRPFVGAEEFINGKRRWCLWLRDATPGLLKSLPEVLRRVAAVKAYRETSTREATRKLAAYPGLFGEIRHPDGDYLLIPSVSSERRPYIPIGFMHVDTIASNLCLIVPGAGLYHLGVLASTMHMSWVRAVCGRLESRYRYSNGIVYNNYPWPEAPGEALIAAVEAAAQGVLDARAAFPEATLAELYDPLSMPPALVKAHQTLDRAVDAAYGAKGFASEAVRLEYLFALYGRYVAALPVAPAKTRRAKASTLAEA